MGEENTKNVMSVELAVRRELAYRHKKALSHSENPNQHLMPLQVPSSGYQATTSNPTSKPSPSNNQFLSSKPQPKKVSFSSYQLKASNPTPKPNQFQRSSPLPTPFQKNSQNLIHTPIRPQNLSPKPPHPQIPIPKPVYRLNFRPNICGTKRKEITSNSQQEQPQNPKPSESLTHSDHVTRIQEGYFYCNLCKVPCSGCSNLNQHLKGHQHKNKLKLVELSKKGVSSPFCEVCMIQCSDKNGLEVHYKSKKHQAKVREVELGGERKNCLTCELCNIWCIDEVTYQQHLRGKNHMARVGAAKHGTRCS